MIRLFKNEEGSTTLTIVVSIVVVVALLAVCLQWYWVNATGSDLQYYADIGAMSAAEAMGRSASLIRLYDAILLGLNIFGLILHGVVVVAGVVATLGGAVGGLSAVFFEKAIEFDRNFTQRKHRFFTDTVDVVKALDKATPFFMLGASSHVVKRNVEMRTGYDKTPYGTLVVPFPATGTLKTTEKSSASNDLDTKTLQTAQKNADDARDIKELQEQVDAAKTRCYEADIYKNPSVIEAYWDPSAAPADFLAALSQKVPAKSPFSSTLAPIDNESVGAPLVIERLYSESYQRSRTSALSSWNKVLSSAQDDLATAKPFSFDSLARELDDATVYLLPHTAGERKAYHADPRCRGLSQASQATEPLSWRTLLGQEDHPPCTICQPFNWEGFTAFKSAASPFAQAWEREASALRAYVQAKDELEEKSDELTTRTQNAWDELVNLAQEYLKGDRISYDPPGSRGLFCIAFTTSNPHPNKATMPGLTNTESGSFGPRVAVAAARIVPKKTSKSLGAVVSAEEQYTKTTYDVEEANKLGGGIYNLFESGGVAEVAEKLYYPVLRSVAGADSAIRNIFDKLPLGLGSSARSFLDDIEKAAGTQLPDLRDYKPLLVDTATVGDPDAPGVEGTFITAWRRAKSAHAQGAQISSSSWQSLLKTVTREWDSFTPSTLYSALSTSINGSFVSGPYNSGMADTASAALAQARASLGEVTAALGGTP